MLFAVFYSSDAGILSSGSNPKDETGLSIFSADKLWAVYHMEDAHCSSYADPLTTTEWTRFTFVWKDNKDTRIYLNNVKFDTDDHPGDSFTKNSAKVINLASSLSSSQWWSIENIQLSDLSLWINIPSGDWQTWAEGLPDVLGKVLSLTDYNLKNSRY